MNIFNHILPETPTENGRVFALLFRAIRRLTEDIDGYLSGTSKPVVRLTAIKNVSSVLQPGTLIYVDNEEYAATTDRGYNAVFSGGTVAKMGSAIAKPGIIMVPGKTYWLQLGDGQITSTPNLNFRLQLLGVAITPSDLHFIYTPPTA